MDIIEGVSYAECLERKKSLSMFWDQCGFGFYGNALVEAAAFGVPCLSWVSDHSLSQMSNQDREGLVVTSFERRDVESCAQAMYDLINSDLKVSLK